MTSMKARRRRLGRLRAGFLLWSALIGATIAATAAQATIAAAPQSNSPPTISGQTREGRTLTALNGSWGNAPTSFSYQWQQCDASGANCNSIVGATSKTYTVVAGDVDHQLRVAVTATNADGTASATSQPSGVISSRSGPTNTAAPTISGTAKVGEELQAQNGTWTGGVKSYAYQWQRCDTQRRILSGRRRRHRPRLRRPVDRRRQHAARRRDRDEPVGLHERDLGPDRPRRRATRRRRSSSTTMLRRSSSSACRRLGGRIYARFSLCDDSAKAVTVIERDSMPGRLAYVRRFSVAPVPCGTHARNWKLIPRFHHQGRFTATLRAVDKSGASSRTVGRSLFFTSGL